MWSAPLLRRGSGTALLSLLCSATSIYHNQTFTFTRNSLNNKYIQCFNWDYKTFFIHTSGMKLSICHFYLRSLEILVSLRCNVLIEIISPFSIPRSKLCCCRSFIWWDWNLSSKSIQMEISDNRRPNYTQLLLHRADIIFIIFHSEHLILTKLKSCELSWMK